jgi:hypothetical protein
MDSKCLTVDLVERLQIAIQRQLPVDNALASMESATLAGIVEYGCLKFSFPERTPALPDAILSSPLGTAARDVCSPIGLRNTGAESTNKATLDRTSLLFHTISSEANLDSELWDSYCYRFERAAKDVGFSAETAKNLSLALHEMAANTVNHSASPIPAIIGFWVTRDAAMFCVADAGIGVLQSLRTSPKHQDLTESTAAIRLALVPGVSRFDHGGTGFNSVFKAITHEWGVVRFRSGNGCVSMDGTKLGFDYDAVKIAFPPALPGFQVSIGCRLIAN